MVFLLLAACDRGADEPTSTPRVVAYCSVDESIAAPILGEFARRTGVGVEAIYDSEAGKTTGLVQRIIHESQSGRVRADVFWSGEVFQTIRLARLNLLSPYASPAAEDIPPRFKDRAGRWVGAAVRARVVAYDPERVKEDDVPAQWEGFKNPRFASRVAIANPLFGTTRGHVAAMFAGWGADRGRSFLSALRDHGARIVDGNSAAVRAVLEGRAEFAFTDIDDVRMAQRSGASLAFRYPDLGDGGTLLIPCTVAVVAGGPNSAGAHALVDYLVSAEMERKLAEGPAGFVPVREGLRKALGISWPAESVVDYEAVAEAAESADAAVRELLIR